MAENRGGEIFLKREESRGKAVKKKEIDSYFQ